MLSWWLTIIIIIAIGIVGGTIWEHNNSWRTWSECFGIISAVTALCFLILWLIGGIISTVDSKTINQRYYTAEKHELKSLLNMSEVKTTSSGSFIMAFGFGSGSTTTSEETKNYYYTLVYYDGIGSKIEKYDCAVSYISEEDIDKPYIEYINYEYTSTSSARNFINGGIFKFFDQGSVTINRFDKYILHVPKNTIKVQWDVSLANVK